MKKLNYLLIVIFAIALMSNGCKKEDNNPTPDEIKPTDLVGDWYFQSLEFNGSLYTTCDKDLNEQYDLITMDMTDVTTTTMTLSTDCLDDGEGNEWSLEYAYVLSNNVINCEDGALKFEIINAHDFDGSVLILKLISASRTGLPISGVYTLTKGS